MSSGMLPNWKSKSTTIILEFYSKRYTMMYFIISINEQLIWFLAVWWSSTLFVVFEKNMGLITGMCYMQLFFITASGPDVISEIPGEFSINQHEETQLDHIPGWWPVVLHQIQSHGYMGVAVVTAEVVLYRAKGIINRQQ